MWVRCGFDVGSVKIGRISSGAERVCPPSMDESGLSKMHRKFQIRSNPEFSAPDRFTGVAR
jgi:hypothetical protein